MKKLSVKYSGLMESRKRKPSGNKQSSQVVQLFVHTGRRVSDKLRKATH